MRLPRLLIAVAVVPLVIVTGIFGCGGRVAEEAGSDAGPVPTATAPTGTSTPPSPPPTPPDAGASHGRPDAGSDFTLDVTACASRTDACHWTTGSADATVDAWMATLVAGCAATPPSCGLMKMKFSRLPDFGGCGQSVSFSAAQPVDFITCLEKELASQRCSTGLWVGSGADVDTRSIQLCPPP